MPDHDLLELAEAFRSFLRPQLDQSPEARRLARLLGAWLINEADASESKSKTNEPEPTQESPAPYQPSETSRGIVPLSFGSETVHVEVTGATTEIGRARQAGGAFEPEPDAGDPGAPAVIDLKLIEQRARLKADSCLHFIDLRAVRYDHEQEKPLLDRMHVMIDMAKSIPDCFLWVFFREKPQSDDDALRLIAGCYEALADSAALVRIIDDSTIERRKDTTQQAMSLFAEASSALRIALGSSWLTTPDADQNEVHVWLRNETACRGIFIDRHMRLDDPADPALSGDLIDRIATLRAEHESLARDAAKLESSFKRINYHARKIESSPERHDPYDLDRIVKTVEDLASRGVPTSDQRFESAIPEAAARVITTCDSRTAVEVVSHILKRSSRSASEKPATPTDRRLSDRVLETRRLLQGRQVVIVGGEPRPDAIERIKNAFELDRVEWVRLVEHGAGIAMRAPIARPETACVIVIIKLCGHHHADEAAACAKAVGKPCVYLTGGYNPEQIAESVLQQASLQLQQTADDTADVSTHT